MIKRRRGKGGGRRECTFQPCVEEGLKGKKGLMDGMQGGEGWPITSDVINVGKRKRGGRWMNGAGIGKKNPLT